ncbi:DUF3299 domain-containing protein [Candidatus Thioglobus sp. NP1]|uniref:DUF3299 domain-containing protein n=1 Tax=Candidatus Thioglobus sp. NP1 TaxID=2508687 RepID=UPI0020C205D1|nr:DUF3299 domain-containing protein [Candidatus Thioglobus sp. NP1]
MAKIIAIFLMALSLNSLAIVVTDDYLMDLQDNWLSLEPAGAYDFIPDDLSYDTYISEDFQNKLDEASKKLNISLEGQDIALAGFMVPVEYQGSDVSKFLLVPESGQCIHVPPPPLNQTLLVDASSDPTEFRDLYVPIIVYGRISVGSQSFDIADSGYTISDVVIETLHFDDDDYNIEESDD